MKFPVAHGMIDNWDDMEKIWSHLFTHELKVSVGNSEDNEDVDVEGVLMTEAARNPKYNREQSCAIMFEKFGADQFFLAVQAILALYSSGRMTGLALQSRWSRYDKLRDPVAWGGWLLLVLFFRERNGSSYQRATLLRRPGL